VETSSVNGELCASVSEKSLKKSLLGIEAEVEAFTFSSLPSNRREAHSKLQEMISYCDSGIALAKVLGKSGSIEHLGQKREKLQNRVETVHLQSVSFNLLDNGLKIYIDGDDTKYSINEEIALPVGSHSYTIESSKYCQIVGEFYLEGGDSMVIDDINLEKHRFPRITLTSNKEKQYITAEINGEKIAIGTQKIYEQCDGTVSYRADYNDGETEDSESGKIRLRAGLQKDIYLHFLSIGDIKKLKNEASPYLNGNRLEFLYSYGDAMKNKKYNKDTHNFQFHQLTHTRFFRYGYGFLWGADDLSIPETKVMEAYYLFAVQFTSFGASELPLRLFNSLSFIPYIGAEVGLGYHEFRDEKGEKEYKYFIDDEEREEDEWKFKRDTLVVKPIVGIDFILSKGFAFKIFAERDLFIDERFFVGTGLSVQF
jgi:hypothetical protein